MQWAIVLVITLWDLADTFSVRLSEDSFLCWWVKVDCWSTTLDFDLDILVIEIIWLFCWMIGAISAWASLVATPACLIGATLLPYIFSITYDVYVPTVFCVSTGIYFTGLVLLWCAHIYLVVVTFLSLYSSICCFDSTTCPLAIEQSFNWSYPVLMSMLQIETWHMGTTPRVS